MTIGFQYKFNTKWSFVLFYCLSGNWFRKEQEERNRENEYTKIRSRSSTVKGIRNGAVLKGEAGSKAGFKKKQEGWGGTACFYANENDPVERTKM